MTGSLVQSETPDKQWSGSCAHDLRVSNADRVRKAPAFAPSNVAADALAILLIAFVLARA